VECNALSVKLNRHHYKTEKKKNQTSILSDNFFFVYVSCCWFSYSSSSSSSLSSLLLLLLREFGVTLFSLFIFFFFFFFSFIRNIQLLFSFLSLQNKKKNTTIFSFCCCHPKIFCFFYLHFKNCHLLVFFKNKKRNYCSRMCSSRHKNSNLFSFSFFLYKCVVVKLLNSFSLFYVTVLCVCVCLTLLKK